MPSSPAPSADTARRAALLGAKLTALAADRGVVPSTPPVGIGVGVAAMAGTTAWALVDGSTATAPERSLGPVLAWAVRRDATEVCVLADSAAGVLARRAAQFDWSIEVWAVVDRLQHRASADAPLAPGLGADVQPSGVWHDVIVAAGAVPVVEHGVLAGEVAGLEVCRVVAGPDGDVLEVGIGAHDRETFQMLHGDRPTLDALRDVVAHIAPHRAVGAGQHPLNQLARSRLLRARLLAEPGLIGVSGLVAAAPPVPRNNVKDEVPCVALAVDESLAVVCSVGIDLDAVAFAADAAAMHGVERCIVAVPARDAVDVQHRLAARVIVPTRVVAVPN